METLNKKRKVQYLILYVNFERFSVLIYLYEEYKKTNRAACNPFFINVMHIYYERIVIDLAKLYINRKNDWFNFSKTVEHIKCHRLKEKQTVIKIEAILSGLKNEIGILKDLRDKEIAHLEKNAQVISANLKHLKAIELLLDRGKEILLLMTPDDMEYVWNDRDSLDSLKKLISIIENHNLSYVSTKRH